MRNVLILLLSLLVQFSSYSQSEETNLYFIRHAEKDRSEAGLKDPHLTEKGKQRAQNWANVLKHVSLDAIYSTDYFRTKETAEPIANSKQLDILLYNPRSLDLNKFMEENIGKSVLIVGHSNSTPTLVNKIIGQDKYSQINDDNNSNLYIVNIRENHITDFLLVVDY